MVHVAAKILAFDCLNDLVGGVADDGGGDAHQSISHVHGDKEERVLATAGAGVSMIICMQHERSNGTGMFVKD
jgi:hypothetical protein